MAGGAEEGGRLPGFDDLPGAHDEDPVAQMANDAQVV
jgi:hypothetical protein